MWKSRYLHDHAQANTRSALYEIILTMGLDHMKCENQDLIHLYMIDFDHRMQQYLKSGI